MVTQNSWWKRKLSGKVWVVDRVHDRGPFEIEIRLPQTNEREAMSAEYLKTHFELEEEWSCPACEGVAMLPHAANCNYANGN